MSKLRAALVTPLSGPLASFGRAAAAGLTLWATQSANLSPPWTGVELEVRDTATDPAAAIRAAIDTQTDVLLVAGNSADELTAAPVLLARSWKAAAFVGAGVEEVLAP